MIPKGQSEAKYRRTTGKYDGLQKKDKKHKLIYKTLQVK